MIDPDISLMAQPAAASQAQYNPLGMVSSLADIQGKLQQNQMSANVLEARRRAGQYFSTLPGDQAQKAIMADPVTSAYAPDLSQDYLNMQQTMLQNRGIVQGQNVDAYHSVMGSLLGAVRNPSQLQPLMDASLGILPPETRKAVSQQVNSVIAPLKGITDSKEYAGKLAGILMSSGITPEAVQSMLPHNVMIQEGNQQQPGTAEPGFAGGEVKPAGQPIGVGVAPQYIAAPGGGQNIYPGQAGQIGGGNVGAPTPGSPQINSPAAPAGVPGAPPVPAAWTGKPLYEAKNLGPNPIDGFSFDVNGQPTGGKAEADAIDNSSKSYQADVNSSKDVQSSLGTLNTITRAADDLEKTQGLDAVLKPGSAFMLRTEMGKFANTIGSILGVDPSKLPINPEKISSAEDAIKAATTMGAQLTHQFMGSDPAASSLVQLSSAIPNGENTYLGLKLVSSGIESALQRQLDQTKFQQLWLQDPLHKGTLVGAVQRFNELHPAKEYSDAALARNGVPIGGFSTEPYAAAAQLKSAIASGKMTTVEAKDYLIKNGMARAPESK